MKTIIVICSFVALIRADVSHVVNEQRLGYQYQNPAPENSPFSSYGAPQGSVLGSTAQTYTASIPLVLPSAASSLNTFNSFPNAPSLIQVPSGNLLSTSSPNSYQFLQSLNAQQPLPSSFGISSQQFSNDAALNANVATSGGNLDDSFGVVTDAAGASAGAGDNQDNQEVAKHLYFFAAPEEEEDVEVQAKVEAPASPPKKTYKIIFIKAPTYRNRGVITVPAPLPNEEKTLVYVLVRKPESQPTVRFQQSAPTQPTKPEVFFIKYRTQQEAEAAVAEIQSKHGATGQVIANLPAGTEQVRGEVSVSSTPSSVDLSGTPAPYVSVGEGVAGQTPTPITFGGNSVDSLAVFGGRIASPRNQDVVYPSELQQDVTNAPEEGVTEAQSSVQNEVVEQRRGFATYGAPAF